MSESVDRMSKRLLIAAVALCACTFRLSAQNMEGRSEPPTISRMCLWNANRDTWSELDLSRSQIHRMEVIKRRYPAVVEGQWMLEDNERQPQAAGNTSMTPIGDPVLLASEQPRDLQSELRAVLTPDQLAAWVAYCNDQITQ
jgi:hypothetical protein